MNEQHDIGFDEAETVIRFLKERGFNENEIEEIAHKVVEALEES